jgi:hypothetical protein
MIKINNKRFSIWLINFFIFFISLVTFAQIPHTLSYQGVLTDSTGNPKPDGSYTFTFRLYDSSSTSQPIWTEQKTLQTSKGLFSTILGDQISLETLSFDEQYWMSIQLDSGPELSPRIPLTSAAYSLNSSGLDSTGVFEVRDKSVFILNASEENTAWLRFGDSAIPNKSSAKIQFAGWGIVHGGLSFTPKDEGNNQGKFNFSFGGADNPDLQSPRLTIQQNGNIGIGHTRPVEKLVVYDGNINLPSGNRLQIWTSQRNGGIHWDNNVNAGFYLYQDGTASDNGSVLTLDGFAGGNKLAITDINVGIGTTNPSAKLEVIGRTKTQVLEITGGSDLAEPFEVTENAEVIPGSVLVIDKNNPGKLKLSTQPYDKCIAGIVSGAGGINPGLTLSQDGLVDNGQNVALVGRVYALASTINGAIEPGDLLTTSSISGHLMKATDLDLSNGAIIGKAMSYLINNDGLVLVLVNLQ